MAAERGKLFADFLASFDCAGGDSASVISRLSARVATSATNNVMLVEKTKQRLAKRSERVANEFAMLVQRVQMSGELKHGERLTQFLIAMGDQRAAASKQNKSPSSTLADRRTRPTHAAHANHAPVVRSPQFAAAATSSTARGDSPQQSAAAAASAVSATSTRFITTSRGSTSDGAAKVVLTGRAQAPNVIGDETMLRHLFSALQGNEGCYIRACRTATHAISFRLDDSAAISDTTRAVIVRVLPAASAFVTLSRTGESQSPAGADLIAQAFYASIETLLDEYSAAIVTLYRQFLNDPTASSFLRVEMALRPWLERFAFLSDTVRRGQGKTGIEILNDVYAVYLSTAAIANVRSCTVVMLQAMCTVFHRLLVEWLLHGQLNKHNENWMIMRDDSVSGSQAWTHRFAVREELVPLMFYDLRSTLNQILVIGKTACLMRSVGGHRGDDITGLQGGGELRAVDHIARKRAVLESLTASVFYDQDERHRLVEAVDRLDRLVGAEIVDELMRKYHFEAHWMVLRRHFLLTDANFAKSFYDRLRYRLDSTFFKAIKFVHGFRCEIAATGDSTSIEVIATRSIQTAIAENVTWGDLPIPMRLEAIRCSADTTSSLPLKPTAIHSFLLAYSTPAPVSIVLGPEAIARYQIAFQSIWTMNCVEIAMQAVGRRIGLETLDVVRVIPECAQMCRLFSVACTEMSQIVRKLHFYIVHDVVDRFSRQFQCDLGEKVHDLEQLIAVHNVYLEHIEQGLFLDHASIKIRTAIRATLDHINEMIAMHGDWMRLFAIEEQRRSTVIAGANGDRQRNEEREIRADAIAELTSVGRAKLSALMDRFRLAIRDLLRGLRSDETNSRQSHLLLQLDFDRFYERRFSDETGKGKM